jgi:hypothetical protein
MQTIAASLGWEDFPPEAERAAELETPAPADAAASADGSPLSPPAMRTAYKERRAARDESRGEEELAFAEEARDATREKVDVVVDDEPEATRFSSPVEETHKPCVRGETAAATSPATSAESRLDRALRAGAVAEARARRAGTATPKAETPKNPDSSRSPRIPTPSSAGARQTPSFAASPASASLAAALDPHVFAAEANRREAELFRRERDEGVLSHPESVSSATIAYAVARPSAAERGGAAAAISVFRADADADALSLSGRGNRDAVDVVSDRGGVSFRKRHEFERVFWCADEDMSSAEASGDASSLAAIAAEVSAPMASAARAGSDATLFVAGGRLSGTTSVADAVAAALAARTLATASARNERAEYLEALAEKNHFRSPTQNLKTRVVCRFAAYQTRGLVADDLLAGHAGARGLRVRPTTTHTSGSHHGAAHGAAHGGLAYEVEGLSKVEVTSLSEARRLLETCRRRRRDAFGKGKESPDAFACEWWLETVTYMTSAAFGVRSRVSRSARARVVDVYHRQNDAADKNNAPAGAFALAQCASAHAKLTSSPRAVDSGDWRVSALTKLSKAPLTSEGLLSVLVTVGGGGDEKEAESAETALRFAGAARSLQRGAKRFSPGSRRTERAVTRRDALEAKLAATRAEARAEYAKNKPPMH